MVARKICIVGDFAVGKTSLVRRYVLNQFDFDYHATLGVNVYKYSAAIALDDDTTQEVDQIIWDLEGSTVPSNLQQTYLKGASGVIVVGDIRRENAMQSLIDHGLSAADSLPGRPILFALNKVDLLEEGDATPEATPLLEHFGQGYTATSAKTGTEVTGLFHTLARLIVEVGA